MMEINGSSDNKRIIFSDAAFSSATIPEYCFTNYVEAVNDDYEPSGPIREFYIDGVWNKEHKDDRPTEVQIPVK